MQKYPPCSANANSYDFIAAILHLRILQRLRFLQT